MSKKYFLLLIVVVCSCTVSWAQPDATLPSLRRVYQSTYFNPGFVPKYRFSVGIPILSNFYLNNSRTGFTLQDVIDCKDEEGLVDLNKFYDKIDEDGIAINTLIQTDIFHVSFPIRKYQIGINSSIKTQTTQAFSKQFIGFLTQGNGYFKGQTAEFKGLDFFNVSYLENGISVARQFRKFSVGVRVKYLQGIAVTETSDLRFSVTTSQNAYDSLTVKSGGKVNTSNVPLLVDSVTGKVANKKDKEFDAADLTAFQNNGYAIDFGFTYQVLPRLMVHGSVMDLGSITWNSRPYNYTLVNADVTLGGFTNDQLNNNEDRANYTDSIVGLLKEATVTEKSFSTKLRSRYFAGADWDLTFRDRVGFLFQGQSLPSSFYTAYTFSYTRRFGVNWDVTANYTRLNGFANNIGLGTSIKMGAFQFYIVQDDIMFYMKPNTSQTLYLRFGLNLVWSEKTGSKLSGRD
ncbi:MAG: DUF5723 family protein [Bacteroidota bacterium]